MVGLREDMVKVTGSYKSYEFVYVECNKCGEKSDNFMYKNHLSAEEQLMYISKVTSFSIQNESYIEGMSYVYSGTNSDEGGMICPSCQKVKNKMKEVSNG